MEKNVKTKILDCIEKVYEESKECKLEESFFSKMDNELSLLSEYFQTTKKQALFISIVFALNYDRYNVDIGDIINHLDCTPLKILRYNDDIKFLLSSGIFIKKSSRRRREIFGGPLDDGFILNPEIADAIIQNKPLPEIQKDKIDDTLDLLEKLYNLAELRDHEEISTRELFMQAEELISEHLHFPLINKINAFKMNIEETYLYLLLIWKIVLGRTPIDVKIVLEHIYESKTKQINYMQNLILGENPLIKNNLIEIVESHFINDAEIKLTDYSNKLLKECDINITINKKKKDDIILPTDIPVKELFFSEAEMKQISLLKESLTDEKFKETQKRLADKNLPKGITVLLHGEPGTGKTEIVKQIARETNRELIKVEISKTKSAWFGESEKLIKRIFTDYKDYAQECERTPILFFNEADAIMSKRLEIDSHSNVRKTENAMQNIILEELENFDGIFFATTNLVNNLDPAFDRRFLFKIRFQKPDISIQAKIWNSKLPFLTIQECTLLAEGFNFSGGQIDNIVRKAEMHEIIYGEKVTIEKLFVFCSEETLMNNQRRIGFNK